MPAQGQPPGENQSLAREQALYKVGHFVNARRFPCDRQLLLSGSGDAEVADVRYFFDGRWDFRTAAGGCYPAQ